MSKKTFAVFAIMLLGAAGAATADEARRGDRAPDPAQVMQHLDTNGDKRISKKEFTDGAPKQRETSQRGERSQRPANADDRERPKPEDMFKAMDRNNDGFLSLQELSQRPPRPAN
ncbi:hypothetical protein Q4511_11155 [Paracoccus sp. 1_MG-2023]|uniref:hypothetical protein n=1 Tax=unclassified Paracoccus (in: a-proteobacteria) TaxID=2688777 RepID=UPI001C099ADC|nr:MULTISPECIES: hypothetical protein [unclassified Paracoccus (in: a-proteobacteria)]MBU2956075.1 hypothetical protein [Paracoccus sp. C2R09]MDO6669481.1 hypothetical protein [Paracoccus sp. 1_MG-2023]